jgi:hypothetical protein
MKLSNSSTTLLLATAVALHPQQAADAQLVNVPRRLRFRVFQPHTRVVSYNQSDAVVKTRVGDDDSQVATDRIDDSDVIKSKVEDETVDDAPSSLSLSLSVPTQGVDADPEFGAWAVTQEGVTLSLSLSMSFSTSVGYEGFNSIEGEVLDEGVDPSRVPINISSKGSKASGLTSKAGKATVTTTGLLAKAGKATVTATGLFAKGAKAGASGLTLEDEKAPLNEQKPETEWGWAAFGDSESMSMAGDLNFSVGLSMMSMDNIVAVPEFEVWDESEDADFSYVEATVSGSLSMSMAGYLGSSVNNHVAEPEFEVWDETETEEEDIISVETTLSSSLSMSMENVVAEPEFEVWDETETEEEDIISVESSLSMSMENVVAEPDFEVWDETETEEADFSYVESTLSGSLSMSMAGDLESPIGMSMMSMDNGLAEPEFEVWDETEEADFSYVETTLSVSLSLSMP